MYYAQKGIIMEKVHIIIAVEINITDFLLSEFEQTIG